jgi:hypothetical protein
MVVEFNGITADSAAELTFSAIRRFVAALLLNAHQHFVTINGQCRNGIHAVASVTDRY